MDVSNWVGGIIIVITLVVMFGILDVATHPENDPDCTMGAIATGEVECIKKCHTESVWWFIQFEECWWDDVHRVKA